MKKCRLLLTVLVAVCCAQFVSGQEMIRMSAGDGVFHVKEIQTIFTSTNDTVTALTSLPKEMRPEGYDNIEMAANDQILMVNAKRVKSIDDFKKIYEELEIGDSFKMGLLRDGRMRIVEFAKVDPDKVPDRGNIVIRTAGEGGGSEGGEHGSGAVRMVVRTGGGEEMQGRPWMGTGLMLDMHGGKVQIVDILEGMTGALGGADVAKHDVITALNSNKVDDVEHFLEAYRKLEAGATVKLDYLRGEKKMALSFSKPETSGQRMMIQR